MIVLIIVPFLKFRQCQTCEIFKYDLNSFISHRCKPPDYSQFSVNLK